MYVCMCVCMCVCVCVCVLCVCVCVCVIILDKKKFKNDTAIRFLLYEETDLIRKKGGEKRPKKVYNSTLIKLQNSTTVKKYKKHQRNARSLQGSC